MIHTWVDKIDGAGNFIVAADVNNLQDLKLDAFDAGAYASFAAAVAAMGSSLARLWVTSSMAVSADISIPATLEVVIPKGGMLAPANATVTFLGLPPTAGKYKVFDCTGTGKVVLSTDAVLEWWGGLGDDATDCTAAWVKANVAASTGIVSLGQKRNIRLGEGVYRVTATSGNYAVSVNAPIVGEGPGVSVIKNVGAGSALHIEGVTGEIYYSRWRDFSVVGNASSEDGIVLNVGANINKAVAYCVFDNVDSLSHGRHGLVHSASWGTKYINCKFHHNGGLGVNLSEGAGYAGAHNNITFLLCESRWNGGTGNNSADFAKGGVRISGVASGVDWIGGVVESNNAWGFIIGKDTAGNAALVNISHAYLEGHPDASFTSASGGAFHLSANYISIRIHDCYICYGAPTGKTGYAFYATGPGTASGQFKEWGNRVVPSGGAGAAIRDSGINYAAKWGSGTELITAQVNRDFSGANNWTNIDFNSFNASGDLSLVSTATQYCHLPVAYINNGLGFAYGKRYGIKFDVTAVTGTIYLASVTQVVKLNNFAKGTGQAFEFTWIEANANKNLFIFSSGVASLDIDNFSIVEIDGGVSPQSITNGLLSRTTVWFAADADTPLYTVPSGKTCVLSHAIVVAPSDCGGTTMSIGANGSETDFIPANTLSNLDAADDVVILQPIPNTTPLKGKAYAAGTVIEARVGSHAGDGAYVYLYGMVY